MVAGASRDVSTDCFFPETLDVQVSCPLPVTTLGSLGIACLLLGESQAFCFL